MKSLIPSRSEDLDSSALRLLALWGELTQVEAQKALRSNRQQKQKVAGKKGLVLIGHSQSGKSFWAEKLSKKISAEVNVSQGGRAFWWDSDAFLLESFKHSKNGLSTSLSQSPFSYKTTWTIRKLYRYLGAKDFRLMEAQVICRFLQEQSTSSPDTYAVISLGGGAPSFLCRFYQALFLDLLESYRVVYVRRDPCAAWSSISTTSIERFPLSSCETLKRAQLLPRERELDGSKKGQEGEGGGYLGRGALSYARWRVLEQSREATFASLAHYLFRQGGSDGA